MAKNTKNLSNASAFDGGMLGYIGINLLATLLCIVTLTLGTPWALCMIYRWKAKHTRINGKKLVFDGKGIQLFGTGIKWLFLIIITLGIFALWLPVKAENWRVKHTRFDESETTKSENINGANATPNAYGAQVAQPAQFPQFTQFTPANHDGQPVQFTQPPFPFPPFPLPPCYVQTQPQAQQQADKEENKQSK